MSIAADTQCLQCLLQRNLDLVRTLGTEKQALVFARRFLQNYLDAPEGVSSPWFGPGTSELLMELYGLPADRFREEKEISNRFVLERIDTIRDMIQAAPDPVFAGLQFSVLGNYLDFAALQGKVSFEKLEEMLRSALDIRLDPEVYASLCRDLQQGKKLLYLTDNAGEIVFDRLFAEEIRKAYPHIEITFCVRGGVTANDATREDAAVVGIPFPVIDNGNCVGGTQMDQLSEEAQLAMDSADVVLAKGMGNTETMYGCGYNVYYAFLVKCRKFESYFGQPMLTPMLVKEASR